MHMIKTEDSPGSWKNISASNKKYSEQPKSLKKKKGLKIFVHVSKS